jgi:hypothetical protein
MALLQAKFLVNYEEQQTAFEDFLRNFKSSSTEAEDALDDLRLDGDGTSDEYDFMDDVPDRTSATRRKTKTKYVEMLQDVADRKISQVLVDLDDLDQYEKNLEDDGVREPLHRDSVPSCGRNAASVATRCHLQGRRTGHHNDPTIEAQRCYTAANGGHRTGSSITGIIVSTGVDKKIHTQL